MIRRRNYFIKKKFQANFAFRFILLLLLEAILIAGLYMYVSNDTITAGYLDSILTVERTPQFFFGQFLLITLIVGLGIAIAAMIVFILLSHRIAGPLYRFEKDLEEVTSGNLTKRINLRRTDQLIELKESLNSLIGSFDSRMGRLKGKLSKLNRLLSRDNASQNASEIYSLMGSIKDEIDRFKVTSWPEE